MVMKNEHNSEIMEGKLGETRDKLIQCNSMYN